MSQGNPGTPKEKIVIGLAIGAGGVYFILVGFGLLPSPGGPKNLHAPLWIVVCIGTLFLLAGIAVLIQGFGRANDQGELPADSAPWVRALQYWIVATMFSMFATIGTWIALAPGDGQFGGSFMVFGAGFNAALARVMFGLGAVITWLCTFAYAAKGVRKLMRRDGGTNA